MFLLPCFNFGQNSEGLFKILLKAIYTYPCDIIKNVINIVYVLNGYVGFNSLLISSILSYMENNFSTILLVIA